MSHTQISDLPSDENDLFDLSEEQMLVSIAGGSGFFEGVLDSMLDYINDGNDGSNSAGLVAGLKTIALTVPIVTVVAADHLEHMITGH